MVRRSERRFVPEADIQMKLFNEVAPIDPARTMVERY
jgi:hypothetical protein